jgi:predicted CXXCH cytochrome family protein
MRKFSLSFIFTLMLFSMFAIAASAEESFGTKDHNGDLRQTEVGTVIENANGTAEGIDTNDGTTKGTVIKNLQGHKTHTSYQNNTNSCASCHQTHTSKGDQLLFADGVYNTCTACHDGTLGFLNVFADGTTASLDGAGTFGGSHGASMHMADDSLVISAAPGGNPVSTSKTKGTMWGESFNCASCHAPHGSYSDRLLQYNPNGIGSMPASQGGNQLENVPVVDTLTGQTAPVVLYRTVDADGTVTVAQYNKSGTTYVKSTAPWLYGYDNRTNEKLYWTRLENATVGISSFNKNVYFSFDHAEVYSVNQAGADILKTATKGFIARPVVVEMAQEGHHTVQSAYWLGAPIAQFGGKTSQELVDLGYKVDAAGKVTNVGVQMSKFCAACHTDYMQANSDGKKSHFGEETAAYRHSTNSDSYTCVRCHYSHGTDAEIMKDALGRTVADLTGTPEFPTKDDAMNYMTDNNASSALKKFTNMSVCWACHNSSHAETIKNAERRADHPIGMPGTN